MIKEEIQRINNININNYQIKFDVYNLKYKRLKLTKDKCIIKNKTYAVNIYIPITIFYEKKNIINRGFTNNKNKLNTLKIIYYK